LQNKNKKMSKWDATPVEKKTKWDQTPTNSFDQTPCTNTKWDQTPTTSSNSKWDETPATFSKWDQTPTSSASSSASTATPQQKREMENEKRNYYQSDEELNLLLPGKGYIIMDVPGGYASKQARRRPRNNILEREDTIITLQPLNIACDVSYHTNY
jgi:Splicing factor 3B subunit 1